MLASVEKLKKGKDLYPGLLGVTMKEGGIDERPTIDHVRYDSPAEKAGLKAGDVLTEIDGQHLRRHDELRQALGHRYAGDKVHVVVSRGKEKIAADLVLVDKLVPYEPPLLGILPLRQASRTVPGERGVTVRYVFPHTAAEKAGIVAGRSHSQMERHRDHVGRQLATLVRRARREWRSHWASCTRSDHADKTVPHDSHGRHRSDPGRLARRAAQSGQEGRTTADSASRQGRRCQTGRKVAARPATDKTSRRQECRRRPDREEVRRPEDGAFSGHAHGRNQGQLLGLRAGIVFRRRRGDWWFGSHRAATRWRPPC